MSAEQTHGERDELRSEGEARQPAAELVREIAFQSLFGTARGAELAGRYEVRQQIGKGTMGEVFRALDRELGVEVAVKVLRHVSPATIYRFKREFRSLIEVSHPYLVCMHELGVDRGTWFLTMDLVDGTDFMSHVTGAAHHDLRRAFLKLAQGVVALHDSGTLHRDLKPSNVMVDRGGAVRILDFGLAADVAPPDTTGTRASGPHGTPAYMAPEQARGEPATPASDWYALGVMLHEALCGQLPFTGSTEEIKRRKQAPAFARPSLRADGVPEDLDQLCAELLDPDPGARPAGDEVLRRLGASEWTRMGSEPPQPWDHFVGRTHELALLEAAMNDAEHAPVVALVAGRSGMGKTALVQHFAHAMRTRRGALVLTGRCYERESVPFKAMDSLIDALCQHLRTLPPREAAALVPANVYALSRLFPVLRQLDVVRAVPRPSAAVPEARELRRRGFEALRELLGRLGRRRPVMLHLDDLHWGDRDSAALLRHLVSGKDAPPMLVVCSYRSEDRAHSPMLRDLADDPLDAELRTVPVGPLEGEDALTLATMQLGRADPMDPDAWARALVDEAAGSPLFLAELVHRALATHTSSPTQRGLSLEDVLRARMATLPVGAMAVLRAVAIAARPVAPAVIGAAAGGQQSIGSSLQLLRAARFVRGHGAGTTDRVECYHDRVRHAVVDSLSETERSACHLQLARALERSGSADSEGLARHFAAGGEPALAASHALRAAHHAVASLAFDRAVEQFQQAIALGAQSGPGEPSLRAQLADALADAGRSAEAGDAYLEARAGTGEEIAFECSRKAAEHYLRSGRLDDGLAAMDPVLRALDLHVPATVPLAMLSLGWRRLRLRLRGLEHSPRREDEVPGRLLRRIDACWSVTVGLGLIDMVRGADYQSSHLLLALEAGEPYRLARAFAMEAGYAASAGVSAADRVAELLRRGEAVATEAKRPHAHGMLGLARAMAAFHVGDWVRVIECAVEAEHVFREGCSGVAWELVTTYTFESAGHFYAGSWDALRERSPERLREALARGDLYAAADLQTGVHVIVPLMADDVAGARRLAAEGKRRWAFDGFQLQHYNHLLADLYIDLYEGLGSQALRRVDEAWGALRRSGILTVQFLRTEARVLRAHAALAAAAEREPDARARLVARARRDARALRREGLPWASAIATLVEAAIANLRGRPEERRAMLERAESELQRCGMTLYAAAARCRRGELEHGPEARARAEGARGVLHHRGIRQAGAVVRMLAPGLDPALE